MFGAMDIPVYITCGLSHADQTLSYFVEAIQTPHTFEELRTIQYGRCLSPLIKHLSDNVKHQAIVSALLCVQAPVVKQLQLMEPSEPSKVISPPSSLMTTAA